MKSLISVIIPCYNNVDYIERSIRSVLNQTYKNIEVIVVDDGSEDNSREVILSIRDKRLIFLRNEKNVGAGASRNRGIKRSKGDLIAFQDSDDEWLPYKLEKQLRILTESREKPDAVYSDVYFVYENKKKIIRRAPEVQKGKLINEDALDYQVHGLPLITFMVKKEKLTESGMFDENLKNLIDLDLFIRLSMKCRFYHIREPLAIYHFTHGISSNTYNLARSRLALLEKYLPDLQNNQKALAQQYYNIATGFCFGGDCRKGRKYYRQSIRLNPFNPRYYLLYLLSLPGDAFFQQIVRIKKAIHPE